MNNIAQQIRQKGYRLTKQRKHIIDILPSRPLSVTEVTTFLASKKIKVDKVTVYRTLDFFVTLGIATKTQFKDTVSKYELLHEREHHHHVVCDQCGSIEDVPLDEGRMLKHVQKQTNFEIKSHVLEFFGLCTRCQHV